MEKNRQKPRRVGLCEKYHRSDQSDNVGEKILMILNQEEGGRQGRWRKGKAEVQELCRGSERSREVQKETGEKTIPVDNVDANVVEELKRSTAKRKDEEKLTNNGVGSCGKLD